MGLNEDQERTARTIAATRILERIQRDARTASPEEIERLTLAYLTLKGSTETIWQLGMPTPVAEID